MADATTSTLDVVKTGATVLGPLLGFASAYFFNIKILKNREAEKFTMLKFILREVTDGLLDDLANSRNNNWIS